MYKLMRCLKLYVGVFFSGLNKTPLYYTRTTITRGAIAFTRFRINKLAVYYNAGCARATKELYFTSSAFNVTFKQLLFFFFEK